MERFIFYVILANMPEEETNLDSEKKKIHLVFFGFFQGERKKKKLRKSSEMPLQRKELV